MINTRQPLVSVAFIFGFGIGLAAWLFPDISYQAWGKGIILSFLGWILFAMLSRGRERLNKWLLVFFYVCVGLSGALLLRLQQTSFSPIAIEKSTPEEVIPIELKGRVISLPIESSSLQKRRKNKRSWIQCILRAEEIRWLKGESKNFQPVHGKVAMSIQGKADFYYGDTVVVQGVLKSPRHPLNPGEFDRHHFFKCKQIYREILVTGNNVHQLQSEVWSSWQQLSQRFRRYMQESLRMGLEEEPVMSALLAGMLFGDRTDFDPELSDLFRKTGTMHLFAVSGQNIGILAAIGILILRMIGLLRWRWGWILIPLLSLYVLATGAQSSAIRAFVMASLVLMAWALDRPALLLQLTCAAGFLILLLDPSQLLDTGFQLSFCVVLSLVLLTPHLYAWLKGWGAPDAFLPRELWPKWYGVREPTRLFCLGTAAVSMAAFMGSTLLSWFHFHLIVPVSLVVNMIVVALASAIVFVAALSLCVKWVHVGLAVYCNNANWLAAKLLLGVVTVTAKLPGGSFYAPLPWQINWSKKTKITILSVGSGQSAIVNSTKGIELYDTGNEANARFIILPFLKQLGCNSLSRIWLSQGHVGHVGGVEFFLKEWPVKKILKTGLSCRSRIFKRLMLSSNLVQEVLAPMRLEETGYNLEILFPVKKPVGTLAQDRALVTQLTLNGHSILFVSDIGSTVEKFLVEQKKLTKVDVLVMGRHPREDSLTESFLDTIHPINLIFCGGGFERAHLSSQQLERLRQRNVRVWNLQKTGAVTIYEESKELKLQGFCEQGTMLK